uniref:Uncharacterized protein n=1 Tax=Lepeophtheirus salmonis TaxID=72036 RepID=A0A0K2TSA0_LEPSM
MLGSLFKTPQCQIFGCRSCKLDSCSEVFWDERKKGTLPQRRKSCA